MFGYVFGLLLPSASWIAANPYWFHPGVICAKGHSTAEVSHFRVQGPNDKHRFKSIYGFIQTLNLNVISFPSKTCAMAHCVCLALLSISFVSVLQHRSISSNHIRKMIPNPSYISPNMPTSQDSVCSCLDVDKYDVRLVGADNTRDGLGISTILLIFVCLGHSTHCAN